MDSASQTVQTLLNAAGLTLRAEEVATLADGYDRLRRSVDALYAVTTGDEDSVLIPCAAAYRPV